jgi:transcription elongation factor
VSVPDPRTLLKLPDAFEPKLHGWVRLRRGIYKGDLAFVSSTQPCLLIDVRVVPRFTYEKPRKRGDDEDPRDDEDDEDFAARYNPNRELLKRASALGRPPPTLFNPTIAKHRFQRAFQPRNSYFLFKGVYYDKDGYALLQTLDTDWYTPEDVIPTPEEFQRFSACSEIPLGVRTATMAKMAAHVLHVDDAVKVVEGDEKGQFGRIIEIKGNEAYVFLPLQGHTSTLPLPSLRKNIRVGDAVRVTSGDHQGFTGWVVNKDDDDLSIFDHKTGNEVSTIF